MKRTCGNCCHSEACPAGRFCFKDSRVHSWDEYYSRCHQTYDERFEEQFGNHKKSSLTIETN